MKPILAIEQDPTLPGLGLLGRVVRGRGLPIVSAHAWEGDLDGVRAGDFAGIVPLGGSMQSWDEGRLPFLGRERELLREAVDEGVPVLGICLGGQLLARALGAEVYPSEHPERGWLAVEATPEAEDDALLAAWPPSLTLRELVADLVGIDSVNPSLVPGGAGEAAIARFVAAWLQAEGLEVHVQEAAPGRPNVIGVARGTGGGRSLMLNAHMDTVAFAGVDRPLVGRVEDGRMYGRGAFDMKAGLAAIMWAGARRRRGSPRAGDVIVTAVCDEEFASVGTQALVARVEQGADAAIVTEPTEQEDVQQSQWLTRASRGTRSRSRGVAAPGSLPQDGVDAIARMGRVLVGIDALGR